MRTRLVASGLLAGLIVLALVLPGAASAAPLALTITLKGTGTGTVVCEAEEGPEECQPTYPAGTELILYAEPGEGSEFVKWTGAGGSCTTEPVCEMKMNTAKSVTATFNLIQYSLSVTKNGTGSGTVQCEAQSGPEECKATYPAGTELTLLAQPKAGSEFVEWGGDCGPATEPECALIVEEDVSVTATFGLEPALTVNKAGTGTGTVQCEVEVGPETCQHSYPKGTELTLLATADFGSTFAGFSSGTGSASVCSTSPCTFTIATNSTVTATFVPIPPTKFKLTVSKSGTGTGTVKGGSPAEPSTINCGVTCEHEYLSGAVVTLTHEAAAGSEFKEWTGACSGSGTCEVTMSAAKSVGAVFNTKPSSGGGGSTGGGGSGGGSSGGGGGGTPPPPAVGTASVAGTATVASGNAAIKLTCSGGPCSGSLTLTAKVKQGGKVKSLVIGRATFDLAAGASATVRIRLSNAAAKELETQGYLKANVAGTGVAPSATRLKLPGGTRKQR